MLKIAIPVLCTIVYWLYAVANSVEALKTYYVYLGPRWVSVKLGLRTGLIKAKQLCTDSECHQCYCNNRLSPALLQIGS